MVLKIGNNSGNIILIFEETKIKLQPAERCLKISQPRKGNKH